MNLSSVNPKNPQFSKSIVRTTYPIFVTLSSRLPMIEAGFLPYNSLAFEMNNFWGLSGTFFTFQFH